MSLPVRLLPEVSTSISVRVSVLLPPPVVVAVMFWLRLLSVSTVVVSSEPVWSREKSPVTLLPVCSREPDPVSVLLMVLVAL